MELPYLTTKELEARIAKAYPSPAYVTLFQVRDGTGFVTSGQAADAMAFATWPSRGLTITGFEIKASRSDWLRELKDPEKAEAMLSYCDEWFLVSCENVVKLEEVPKTWGWAVGTTRGLKIMKKPEPLQPKEISKIFLMSIVRNIHKNYTLNSDVKAQITDQLKIELEKRRVGDEYENKRHKEKAAILEKFYQASGIDLADDWRFPVAAVGKLIKMLLEDSNLEYNVRSAIESVEKLREVLKDLESVPMIAALKPEEK